MRRSKFIPVVLVLSVLLLGSFIIGRNALMRGRNITNQQGRNLIGQNMQSTLPRTGTTGTLPGTANSGLNQGTGLAGTTDNRLNTGTGMNITGQGLQMQSGFDSQRADNVRKQLAGVSGIGNVNAIVNGNTALIGYSPKGNQADTNAARNTITQKIKSADKTITNVVVSDSADFTARITRLANNIKSKRPVSDMNNEFNQIIQSIKSVTK